MNRLLQLAVSVAVGVVAFLAVGAGVTEALATRVWPSLMLGLPAGLVAGVAAVPLAYFGLSYWEERSATGQASARTVTRLQATVAALAAFVVVGGLAVVAVAVWAVGLATAIVFVGFPVGLLAAAVAVYLVSRRGGDRGSDEREQFPGGGDESPGEDGARTVE